nr:hypothetical protein [Tanacetum cinerariifolium]
LNLTVFSCGFYKSSPPQQPQSSPQAPPQGAEFPTHFQQVLDTCSTFTRRVHNLEHDKAAQKLEIIKLKARVKRLERANKGRLIDDLDKDKGIELVVDQVKDANIAETEGRHAAQQAEKQAEIYHLDLDHPSKICPIFQARFNANMRFLFKSREEIEEEDQELILLVEGRYPLSRFTLEQFQVEEESEMSLELLRLKLKLFKIIAAADMK